MQASRNALAVAPRFTFAQAAQPPARAPLEWDRSPLHTKANGDPPQLHFGLLVAGSLQVA